VDVRAGVVHRHWTEKRGFPKAPMGTKSPTPAPANAGVRLGLPTRAIGWDRPLRRWHRRRTPRSPAGWHAKLGEGTITDVVIDRIACRSDITRIEGDESVRRRVG